MLGKLGSRGVLGASGCLGESVPVVMVTDAKDELWQTNEKQRMRSKLVYVMPVTLHIT